MTKTTNATVIEARTYGMSGDFVERWRHAAAHDSIEVNGRKSEEYNELSRV